MTATLSSSPPTPPISLPPVHALAHQWVVCLCADWCGVCRDYRAVFEHVAHSLQSAHPQFRFAWVDVEDEAGLIGDLDVETFPTVLIANADGTRFIGPVTPQAHVLQRLLESLAETAPGVPDGVDCAALLQALPTRPELWVHAAV